MPSQARKDEWDRTFMDVARRMSEMSYCASSKKVCCLLVDSEGQIISSGINGTLPGELNCNDIFKKDAYGRWMRKFRDEWRYCGRDEHSEWSKANEIHAEKNAIVGAASSGRSTRGSTAYITHSPCSTCVLDLVRSGVVRVVVGEIYNRDPEAFKLLVKRHIEVKILDGEEGETE